MEYNDRVWLNDRSVSSSGSVVAYHGDADWSEETVAFLEVADCHGKIRLHKTDRDTYEMYVTKLKKLHDTVGLFIEHLEGIDAQCTLVKP